MESVEASLSSASVGSLCELLKLLALLRCEGQLFLPAEREAYRCALEDDSIIPRMAVAAMVVLFLNSLYLTFFLGLR